MVLKLASQILPRRIRRALYILRYPNAMIEKQFTFAWTDSTTRNVQWHLIDYKTYAEEGYSQNALAHMAIKYKIDSLALVPLRAYSGDVDSPDVLPPDNPLAMLCARPNAYQSWYEFMAMCDMYYNISGNAFIYKRPSTAGSTLPEALFPLRPDRVFIKPIKKGRFGDVVYVYVPEGQTYQTGFPIAAQDMMHIKTSNPYDELEGMGYGLPPLMPVSRDVDMDNMWTKFLFGILSHNGVMPGGFIEVPFDMDEDDMNTLRQQFLDSEGGYQNWGRPMVLDNQATYKPSVFTLDQLNIDMLDRRQIKRVMGVFGVPGKLLGLDDEGSTFSNVAEAREEFWTRTMLAEIKIFEDEFAYRLREEGQDWFVRFDTGDVPALQQDLMEASQIFQTLVRNGVPINIASARAKLDIPLIDGGDTPMIASDLILLADVGKSAMLQESNPQESDNPTEDEGTDTDNDVEDVPTDDDKRKFRTGFHRWDFDQKMLVGKAMDEISTSFEPQFRQAATDAFKADQQAITDIIGKAKHYDSEAESERVYKTTKAIINWPVARSGINLYLSTTGSQRWRTTFAPVIISLTNEQTEEWIQRAPDIFPAGTFSLRNVQGEAWFNEYLLKFATEVNEKTRDDIHRIIADGLEAGLSNDKLADALDKLFDQYIKGDVDPETYAFLQERMPIHRRELIARTETHGAMSAGNHELYKQAGIQKREWLGTGDTRIRDTHAEAWKRYSEGGSIGPITFQQSFIVGGHAMKHPGDKSAPIQEWIQCRCTEIPFIE